jgi:GTPase KRas protein
MSEECKIVVVGDGGVGKSSLTIQFLLSHFIEEYDPTIEDAYRKQVIIDGELVLLDILDTAGQEDYSAMRDCYMKSGHGFVLVYSITSLPTFIRVEYFIKQIFRLKGKEKVPMILIGNKLDLDFERVVTSFDGFDFARKYNIPFFESSAKLKINVEESFFQLVREIRKERNIISNNSTKKYKKRKNIICLLL